MRRFFRVLIAALAMAAAAPAAWAQTERAVFVSVLDSGGSPITGLGQDAFTVREDGQRREVLRVSRATQPIDVAVLVDNSQAVNDIVNDVRQATRAFVARLAKDGDSVAVIGLADRPTILQDYTTSQAALAQATDRIFAQPGSGTTLLDALIDTSRGLSKRDAERRAIVVITTEGTDFSNPNYTRALDALRDSSAALYALVLTNRGGDALRTEEGRNRGLVLDQGTSASGGRLIHVITSMALGSKLDAVAGELEQQYHVVYSRPGELVPPKKVEAAVNRAGATVHTTRAAVPPKPASGE